MCQREIINVKRDFKFIHLSLHGVNILKRNRFALRSLIFRKAFEIGIDVIYLKQHAPQIRLPIKSRYRAVMEISKRR